MSKKEILWYFFQGVIVVAGVLYFAHLLLDIHHGAGVTISIIAGITRARSRYNEMQRYKQGVPGRYKIDGTTVYIR